jgi:hypothetical protein
LLSAWPAAHAPRVRLARPRNRCHRPEPQRQLRRRASRGRAARHHVSGLAKKCAIELPPLPAVGRSPRAACAAT